MNNSSSPPAIWDHCRNLYEAMEKAAGNRNAVEVPGVGLRVIYKGYISRLISELHISPPYYGKVLRILQNMGCIQQHRRGGGPRESEWVLLGKPTYDKFQQVLGESIAPSQRRGKTEAIEQQVRDLKEALGGVNIPQAVYDLQRQINVLKEKVHEH